MLLVLFALVGFVGSVFQSFELLADVATPVLKGVINSSLDSFIELERQQ